jgi:hypothetical protein
MRLTIRRLIGFAVGFCATVILSADASVLRQRSSYLHDPERVQLHSTGLRSLPPDDPEARECFEFLLEYMPERDLGLNISMLLDTVSYALLARRTMPWGSLVPWPLFLNDVLPYSFLAEPRNPWRPFFWNYFTKNQTYWNALQNMTIAEAAAWMNTWAWHAASPPIHFVEGGFDGLNAYSPFQVIARGNSSCTGLSITLSAALRSVGIPARIAGTPHWNLGNKTCPDGDDSADCGNHDWVEAWTDGGWSFLDEAGDKKLNTSWFFPSNAEHQVPGTLNHSIFATSWIPSDGIPQDQRFDSMAVPVDYFPMVWDWSDHISSAWDVTRRYLSMLPGQGSNVAPPA